MMRGEFNPFRAGQNFDLGSEELKSREEAVDYTKTFCGHCNTTTDIKEASFLGNNAEFIAPGSDDGKFFIWDKSSTNIVKVFQGDESIVNCLQSHPNTCLLASSGIDPVVRLWAPFPESGRDNDRVVTADTEEVRVFLDSFYQNNILNL